MSNAENDALDIYLIVKLRQGSGNERQGIYILQIIYKFIELSQMINLLLFSIESNPL